MNGARGFAYCGDIEGVVYLHGSGNDGQFDNMDIDCDGKNGKGGNCGADVTGQDQTSFRDQLSQFGIDELDANVHPYVVFGNDKFDPQQYGMEPLSVMAVVCNNQVVCQCRHSPGRRELLLTLQLYGVWGDTNGEDSTGEASISLAQMCFPDDNINGDKGHGNDDVLYLGFTGKNAVPGSSADWKSGDRHAFEKSIMGLGDELVSKLKA